MLHCSPTVSRLLLAFAFPKGTIIPDSKKTVTSVCMVYCGGSEVDIRENFFWEEKLLCKANPEDVDCHCFSVLKGRGVHVVQINRLTSEEHCRQACQSPGASGSHHCNWSVPYQNHCLLLQCHQLSVCQNAGEQDIKDLLAEAVSGKWETALFQHQSHLQKTERMLNAQIDQHSVENTFSLTAQTHNIHLRHLLGVEKRDVSSSTRKEIESNDTTTAPAITANITHTTFSTTYETTAKASSTPGDSDNSTKATSSSAFPHPQGNISAPTSSHVTQTAYESYKKKDYTQVDYLINGMYVDSEMVSNVPDQYILTTAVTCWEVLLHHISEPAKLREKGVSSEKGPASKAENNLENVIEFLITPRSSLELLPQL
ncbi:hypothetical protein IHE44_0014074 [Lamprotornis superbus]|uniref:Uncharacterized protein n=1 Tax=Lamprotornis superbus TaxID=245042 RepID=A0A835TXB8_9PASS|nr:hypothetical protein IHE44_0014074 [Lamprotornis superbus]